MWRKKGCRKLWRLGSILVLQIHMCSTGRKLHGRHAEGQRFRYWHMQELMPRS